MAVISVSITVSEDEIVAGIPKTVTITTNIPSSIFYTLDGTDPTLFSNVYIGPIFLPSSSLLITLKVLASNGTDSSPIITEVFETNMLDNTRLPHSATDSVAGSEVQDLYPFGDPPFEPNQNFLSPGEASITVDDPAIASIPGGFDGNGNENNFTDEPFNVENYSIKYSTTNAEGQTGSGIGNLPANVKIQIPPAPPDETEQFSNLFDPRAFVIFQDFSEENPNDPPQINRQFFSLEDSEKIRDGNNFFNSGLDSPPVTGSFLRSYFNPRDNTITYYYRDNIANKWIISKTPYQPTGGWDGNLSQIKFGRDSNHVYEWLPFARRVLF